MRENTFTGPYEFDLGKGNSATISARLISLRDQTEPKLPDVNVVKRDDILRGQAVTGEYVFFRRSGGVVTQALMDDLLGPTVFPSWPDVDGFSLVYSPNWWPVEHGNMPAFEVKRDSYGSSIGGDWVRGSTNQSLPNAVLKYPTNDPVRRSAVVGKALLYVQAAGYDSVQIEWDWPTEAGHIEGWKEVALVRSMFGAPTTPMDGQTLFRRLRKQMLMDTGDLVPPPTLYDTGLTSGMWYYYTLFFNISPHAPDLGDWVTGYTDWAQVPNRYRHDEHLWNGLPPYYQWVDDNQFGAPLKNFLKIFGFELDNTRQSVECMQDMYHIDKTPIPLLHEIGCNFDVHDEQGLGDIRFRAGLADLAERLTLRGTQKGLQQTIETLSKYDTDVTLGQNMMLLPDDSSAFFSTGNWAGKHPNLSHPAPVTYDKVKLEQKPIDSNCPNVGEDGFMRITASALGDVLVTCGCGWIYPTVMTLPGSTDPLTGGWLFDTKNITEPGEYIPLTNGIPVEETGQYGFSAYLRNSVSGVISRLVILWFNETGSPVGQITPPVTGDPPGGAFDGNFHPNAVQGKAPTGAAYLVPAILIQGRPTANAYVDMTAAMVYMAQRPGSAFDVTPPDLRLRVGDPTKQIGVPPKPAGSWGPADPNWPGYSLGAPADKENP